MVSLYKSSKGYNIIKLELSWGGDQEERKKEEEERNNKIIHVDDQYIYVLLFSPYTCM